MTILGPKACIDLRRGVALEMIISFLLIYVCVVGLLQSTILESVGCIWFHRSEAKDREIVARK